MALSLKDKEILEQLKNNLVQALDGHMKIIKAFGSRVRGDAHEWSDLDVIIEDARNRLKANATKFSAW